MCFCILIVLRNLNDITNEINNEVDNNVTNDVWPLIVFA